MITTAEILHYFISFVTIFYNVSFGLEEINILVVPAFVGDLVFIGIFLSYFSI